MNDPGTGQGFTGLVQRALRAYRSDAALARIRGLTDLRLVQFYLCQTPRDGISGAVRTLLTTGLGRLAEIDAAAADLLVRRYVQGRSSSEIAAACGYSESAVFQKQRRAVVELAHLIWQAEEAHRSGPLTEAQQAALDALPPPTFSRLFGVSCRLADVSDFLRSQAGPFLVAIEGMGGVGKTALARTAAEQMVREGRFTRVLWVTAQQRAFSWSRDDSQAQPALTLASLLHDLALRLGMGGPALQRPSGEQEMALRAALRTEPTLLVVDNLETAADVRELVQGLDRLARPTKTLLTTRHRVSSYDQVTSVTLSALPPEDAMAFIHYHARERNVPAVIAAGADDLRRIAWVTDGNPLAIKLVIGQMLSLPLDQVIAELTVARAEAKRFYRYVFRYSWDRLSPTAQRLLLHMPLLDARGATMDEMKAISRVADDVAGRAAVQELVNVSLLDAAVERGRLLYSIHRLTERFILSDLVGRGWDDDEQ